MGGVTGEGPSQFAPEVVFSSSRLRATCYGAGRKRLTVGFDHLRPDRHGFPQQPPPQRLLQAGAAHLVVETARNDWFLNPDLPALRAALQSFSASFDDVSAIGFSFGGYGALLLARALCLRHALLVSPQFSIFPERAPFEQRYRHIAAGLDPALDDLDTHADPELQGCILYDPRCMPQDALHATLILRRFPGLRALAMPFGGHPALRLVREAHLFARVQRMLAQGEISPAALHRLHRAARPKSPSYALGLARYHSGRARLAA